MRSESTKCGRELMETVWVRATSHYISNKIINSDKQVIDKSKRNVYTKDKGLRDSIR